MKSDVFFLSNDLILKTTPVPMMHSKKHLLLILFILFTNFPVPATAADLDPGNQKGILSLLPAYILSGAKYGRWGQCADYSFLDPSAECALVRVPLDYSNPRGRAIEISAFRYLGSAANKKGQIWFLEGGPGASGRLLSRAMQQLASYYPDYDYYSLDHRGVGSSTRLGCIGDNDFGEDWQSYQACYDALSQTWGSGLQSFNTTNAAHDLHSVITKFRQENIPVIVWGTSYGTYWLQRYLQLFPQGVDGIILDSICTAGHCYLDHYDSWNDTVGKEFLQLCDNDLVCSVKMQSVDGAVSTLDAFEKLFTKIDTNGLQQECSSLFTRESLRHKLAQMVINWSERILIPPLIYRLNRCNCQDQAALATFLTEQPGTVTDRHLLNSPMLCDLISLSELYSGKTTVDLEAFSQQALFSEDTSLRFARIMDMDIWQLYTDAQYAQKLPTTAMPIQMLNGTTDPQTPLAIAQNAGTHFTGQYQQFTTTPFSTHGVLVNSTITPPPWQRGGQEQTCGSLLFGQFVGNPKGMMDTTCTTTVYPVEFDGNTSNNISISNKYFGIDNMWE